MSALLLAAALGLGMTVGAGTQSAVPVTSNGWSAVSIPLKVGQQITLLISGGGAPDQVGWPNPNWAQSAPQVGALSPAPDGMTAGYSAMKAGEDSVAVTVTSGGVISQGFCQIMVGP